jgi:predicted sugar kinase
MVSLAVHSPLLAGHVRRIALGIIEEQMVRSNARRIVTTMADEIARRYRPVRQNIGNSVGLGFSIEAALSISVFVSAERPLPASFF